MATWANRLLRLFALCCLAWVVLAAVVPPSPAHAGDEEEEADPTAAASKRFRRGVKLYNDGDYVAALVEFKRAYELKPHYRVLYNLGQTNRGLKDYAAALQAYEQYLEEGGKKLGVKRRNEVEGYVEELTNQVGTLTITTNVDGAEIQIDDVVVGLSPLDEPIVVNVGRRRVVASLTGHAPARKVIEVGGTDELEVELELADLEADRPDPSPSPTPPDQPPPEPGPPIPAIVAASVTGASAIVTGVLGGLALSARSDLDDALAAYPGNPATIQDAQDRTAGLALATDVMIGVTAAAAVATVVLFVVDPGSESDADEPAEDDGDEDALLRLEVGPSVGGLWLLGSF